MTEASEDTSWLCEGCSFLFILYGTHFPPFIPYTHLYPHLPFYMKIAAAFSRTLGTSLH